MGDGERVRLRTLGGLELWIDEQRVDSALPVKAAALLVLLADRGDKISRAEAAGLLWSDHTEERARGNLRATLRRLRAVAPDLIDADRHWIWLDGELDHDVARLSDASADEIVDLYRGDFLAGHALQGAELFEEWAELCRAELRMQTASRLLTGAEAARGAGDWQRCRRLSRALVDVAPWREDGLRLLIEATAAIEGRTAGLALFDQLADRLQTELGVAPEDATLELVADLHSQSDGRRFSTSVHAGATPAPIYTSTFHGRADELELLDELSRPGRPLSIVAPGGTGKSRVLAELASRRLARGEQVLWVSFESRAPSSSEETTRVVIEETLTALDLPVDTQAIPLASLIETLGSTPQTLCFDNVEHLDGIERPIAALAQACHQLEIILTSRRRLLLASGKTFELQGLEVADDADGALSPAVQLFLDRAHHRHPGPDELGSISELCRLVGGHPLAIELGAQWTSTASIAELVDRLSDADGVSTTAVDVADRHRSLDIVVSSSTDQLSQRARRLLRVAAVFSSRCTRADIAAVTDAAAEDLAELVEHSMLTVDGEWYHVHPVVRAYALRALDPPIDPPLLLERHANRMVELMAGRTMVRGPATTIRHRAEDLRRAIRWRITHGEPDALIADLRHYLHLQRAWGWYRNTHLIVTEALQRSDLLPEGRAELHRSAAEASLHTGDYDDAQASLERGLAALGHPTIPQHRTGRAIWNARSACSMLASPVARPSTSARRCAAEQARLMSMLGEICYLTDRRDEMASYVLGSVAAGRRSGVRSLRTAGDAALAIGAQLAGSDRVSEHYRRRARRNGFSSASDPFTVSETAGVAALTAAGAGRWDDALSDADASLAAADDAGRIRTSIQVRILQALINFHRGRYVDSLALLLLVERDVETYGFRRASPWVHATRAETLLRVESSSPTEEAGEAMSSAVSDGTPVDVARAAIILARLALRHGAIDEATARLETAVPHLGRGAAISFQHVDAHIGAAKVAGSIERERGVMTPVTNGAFEAVDALARSIPIVRPARDRLAVQRSISSEV